MFSELFNQSIFSNLESTIPPVTVPAWISMFTGKNPGKLGCVDFIYPTKFYQLGMSKYKGKMLWDILLNKKVGVFNVPGIEPYKVNGVMSNFEKSYPQLKIKLKTPPLFSVADDKEKMKLEFSRFEEEQEIILNFLKKLNFHLMVYVTTIVDHTSHFTSEYNEIIRAYRKIDEFLERLLPLLQKKNYSFLIVSDHGIKKAKKRFNVNTFLENLDLLKERKDVKLRKIVMRLANIILERSGRYLLHKFRDKVFKKKTELETMSLGMIDFRLTKIFGFGTAGGHSFPLLYVNDERFINGRYKISKHQLLDAIKHSEERNIVKNVWYKTEVYWGDRLNNLPDFILKLDENYTIDYRLYPSVITKTESFVHSKDGLLIFNNSKTKCKKIKTNILDITPTVLHMFGGRPMKNIDGKIMKFS